MPARGASRPPPRRGEGAVGARSRGEHTLLAVTLYLSEADVAGLAGAEDAVPVIEACFRRLAAGSVEVMPRRRFPVDSGYFAVMAAADRELGMAGLKSYALVGGELSFVVCLFELDGGKLDAVIEADKLGQLRTGAASGVAAAHLARRDATSVGLIGCGWQAETQLAAIRAACPAITRAVVWCRTPERLAAFCERHAAEPADGPHEPSACDVVVTATTSRDPVLRGDWLRDGALVCAVGANDPRARELDALVIERASFVCCDSIEDAKLESGDLIDPVAAGQLDWLDVHELQEVVAGEVAGRQAERDIVVFKSNGIAAWDIAMGHELVVRARERGVGREL
jgi:ornithine cyclodeaminase/alanine dehydrogenase-like protein (mu-crystallin family)